MKKIVSTIALFLLIIPVFKINAATASFYTEGGGTFYTGNQVTVNVYANGSDPYNAVTVNVNYSNLTFLGASVIGGWTGVSGPSNNGSSISFSGALLGGSASGSRGVLSLSFRLPYSAGSSSVASSGTIALADGSGTQVNGGGNTIYFNIVTPPPPPPPPEPAPNAVAISSATHPSQETWYKNKSATIAWNKEDKVDGFSYILDKEAGTVPDDTSEGSDTTKIFENLADGVHYFHIKAHNNVGWGETAHFRINIDTTQPDPFGIAKLENETSDKYILFFHTNDSTSGIDYYTIEADGVDLGKQKTKYEIDINVGTIIVTAFDKAGNSRAETFIINEPVVSAPVEEDPFVFDFKSALLTILFLLILSGIGAGTFIGYKKYRTRTKAKIEEGSSK